MGVEINSLKFRVNFNDSLGSRWKNSFRPLTRSPQSPECPRVFSPCNQIISNTTTNIWEHKHIGIRLYFRWTQVMKTKAWMPGLCTLTATTCPVLRSLAWQTFPSEAAATGSGEISDFTVKESSQSEPNETAVHVTEQRREECWFELLWGWNWREELEWFVVGMRKGTVKGLCDSWRTAVSVWRWRGFGCWRRCGGGG